MGEPQVASCPSEGRDYVRLTFETSDEGSGCSAGDPAIVTRIRDLIGSELARDAVQVCETLPQAYHPPLATIVVSATCAGDPTVHIEVSDLVTQKQVARALPLAGLPRDTHPMAIAVGTVELLRASWAESRSARTAKTPLNDGPVAAPPKTKPVTASTTIGLVGEAFSGGLRQMGLDAGLAVSLTPRTEWLARFGGRGARSVSTENGRVAADAWVLGTGLSHRVLQASTNVELRLCGRLDGAWLSFSAVPKGKAVATRQSGTLLWSSLSIESTVRLVENAWLLTEVGGGYVVLPLVAMDEERTVFGAEGVYVSGRLGVKVGF